MNSAWQEVELQDIANFQNGYAFKSDEYVPCSSNGKEVLRMGYIQRGGGFKEDGKPVYAPLSSRGNDRRYELDEGDIVIAMTDMKDRVAILGNCARIPSSNRFLLNQRVGKIRSKNNKVANQHFLYYYMNSPSQVHQLRSMANRGVQVNLTTASIIESLVFLPPIQHQEAIAHILGTLDDKIELNRKTNETLEAMAKALFKSWFVDFDPVRAKAEGRPTGLPAEISDLFPDSFEDSELGEIPRGWQSCPFTQLVDVISGGTPKTSVDEYWNGSIPWFSVVDAPSGADCWVIQTEKSITHLGLDNCSSKLLPIGTTIISARGTVGKVCLTGQDMAMNQSCYGLRSKAANGEFFCFYLTKSIVEILEARAHGSVFSTITRDTLDGVSTISPPLEVKSSFNSIARALLGKINNNLEESRILGNQRDTLLPKLISGEIRIPDAEKMLEDVGI
jgi:type I restriction enzyme S subunit